MSHPTIESAPAAELLDESEPIPADESEASEALLSYLERRNLTLNDLLRIGGRVNKHQTILYVFYTNGVKMRDLLSDRKWSMPGSTWEPMKIIPGPRSNGSKRAIVVEGESDAARMSGPDGPGWDVAVLGGGASNIYDSYIEALREYDWVYLAQDADSYGEASALELERKLTNTVRWRPPAKDWCQAEAIGEPPRLPEKVPLVVWGDALHEIDYPEEPSVLSERMLPTNGIMMIHGWKGAYKSWLAFDLAVALATGTSWGKFNTLHPELRVLISQYELPFEFYRERMQHLASRLHEDVRERYRNIGTYAPLGIRWDATSEKAQDEFLGVLAEQEVDVVIFDPIRRMIGGKSHYEQELQGALVDFFQKINQAGVAVVFTHHDGKMSARAGGGNLLDASAADALVGSADAVVSIALPRGEDWNESKRRNLHYYARNGPTPDPSAMTIEGDTIHYHDEPFQKGDEDVTDAVGI